MPESPTHDGIPGFEILENGRPLEETTQVISLRVISRVNTVCEARIVLQDGNAAEGEFPISDSKIFYPGNGVVIMLGYDDANSTVFKGIVTGTHIRATEEGSTLSVTCHDVAVRMGITRHSRTHHEATDSQLISQICSNYGISSSVTDTGIKHGKIHQHRISDFDLIVARSLMNGMLVRTGLGTLHVEKPASNGAALELTYGDDIVEADLRLDGLTQYEAVLVCCSDSEKEAFCEETSREPVPSDHGNITGRKLAETFEAGTQTMHACSSDEMKQLQCAADACLRWSRLAKITGHLVFQGSAKARTNSFIALNNLGERFDGKAFVSGIVHSLEGGNWTTRAEIGLPPETIEAMWPGSHANTCP